MDNETNKNIFDGPEWQALREEAEAERQAAREAKQARIDDVRSMIQGRCDAIAEELEDVDTPEQAAKWLDAEVIHVMDSTIDPCYADPAEGVHGSAIIWHDEETDSTIDLIADPRHGVYLYAFSSGAVPVAGITKRLSERAARCIREAWLVGWSGWARMGEGA